CGLTIPVSSGSFSSLSLSFSTSAFVSVLSVGFSCLFVVVLFPVLMAIATTIITKAIAGKMGNHCFFFNYIYLPIVNLLLILFFSINICVNVFLLLTAIISDFSFKIFGIIKEKLN